ncbi:hypothetical protein CTM45_10705 [Prevotella intermedia]|nr:hypothetical protein CTM45_10705 [Prevotella intermedia]
MKKRSCFVKIVPKKNGNFGLALRKRLFCIAKPTLLPCKIISKMYLIENKEVTLLCKLNR